MLKELKEIDCPECGMSLGISGYCRNAQCLWVPEVYTEAELKEAVQAEREACALVCDNLGLKWWRMYKGREPEKLNNPGRADPHFQGKSDGAVKCSEAIRARGE